MRPRFISRKSSAFTPIPIGRKRALIMQAFSYHRDKDYPTAAPPRSVHRLSIPTDEDAAYAQYLLALSYYDQIDEVGRDQGLTFQALQSLREVIERYPDS